MTRTLCAPWPISSASHKTTHNQESITHRQSVGWTQSLASSWPFGCHWLALPRVTLQTFGLWARPRFSEKSGPLTYGPTWSHKWSEMVPDTYLQKSHGPIGGEKWSQQLSKCRYLCTDLSTLSIDLGRYRWSIRIHLLENTIDIDCRCRFTYGKSRSIVDGRLKIEIILWLISSTTPVKHSENMSASLGSERERRLKFREKKKDKKKGKRVLFPFSWNPTQYFRETQLNETERRMRFGFVLASIQTHKKNLTVECVEGCTINCNLLQFIDVCLTFFHVYLSQFWIVCADSDRHRGDLK